MNLCKLSLIKNSLKKISELKANLKNELIYLDFFFFEFY